MKKIILLLFSILILSCDFNDKEYEKITPIEWYEVPEFILISRSETTHPPLDHIIKRSAYIKSIETGEIYYVPSVPEKLYITYLKDAKEGDTITIF
jgi:hypothetical protein